MVAPRHDLPPVEDEDERGVADGAKTMGDDDDRLADHEFAERILDGRLVKIAQLFAGNFKIGAMGTWKVKLRLELK